MSESLPPLDDHDIAAVAEGFERLDRRREQLDALRGDLKEVDLLASRQRTYARQVIAWLADEVRSAESRRDTITRTAREAAERLATEQQRTQRSPTETWCSKLESETAQRSTGSRTATPTAKARLLELRGQIEQGRAEVSSGEVPRSATKRVVRESAVSKASDTVWPPRRTSLTPRQQSTSPQAANADSVAAQATATAEGSADADDAERLMSAHRSPAGSRSRTYVQH